MKAFFVLTKSSIILFSILSALAGFAMSYPVGRELEFSGLVLLICGLYLICAGSFALNQAQEWKLDAQMPRTSRRPIPQGQVSPAQAYVLSILLILSGFFVLWLNAPLSGYLALSTVVLYNGFYTMFWKRKWAFGAVPGAIPGAMPVVIGYAVNSSDILNPQCVYLFLVMFLWQMPHFWSLSIKFKDDYKAGGIPVLPNCIGVQRTIFHIGLYTFAYVGLAAAAPWYFQTNVLYVLLLMPLCIKLLIEFSKYFRSHGQSNWLPFFLWVNVSMLVFLGVPVFDKWFYFVSQLN